MIGANRLRVISEALHSTRRAALPPNTSAFRQRYLRDAKSLAPVHYVQLDFNRGNLDKMLVATGRPAVSYWVSKPATTRRAIPWHRQPVAGLKSPLAWATEAHA
jgi:hypothetical protein